jgi:hypothetical protein
MERLALVRHPETACDAVTGIDVAVDRAGSELTLQYRVFGDISGLVLPEPGPVERADDLWRTTCFEAFVRKDGGPGYCEFNLSPSTQWAAYAFSAYRDSMRELDIPPPRIKTDHTFPADVGFELRTSLTLPASFEPDLWHVGLSAVIEECGGRKSYWAVKHAPGAPDFHHEDCFALKLAAARVI